MRHIQQHTNHSRSNSRQQSSSQQAPSSHNQSNELIVLNNNPSKVQHLNLQNLLSFNNTATGHTNSGQFMGIGPENLSNPQFYMSHQSQANPQHYQTSSCAESEFSLGQGTKNMIRMKADSILDQVRSEFRSKNSNGSLQ